MNSITHAYSVVAFLLVIGCTLIGFPMSVFSQDADLVESQVTLDEEETAEDISTSTESAEVVLPSSSYQIVDNYPREVLPDAKVYNDFVVGPGKFSLELAPGESKTVEMMITNRMGEKKRFSFGTEDTAGSSDGSESVVLLGDAVGPYTLRDYIKIPYPQFDLEHGQRVRVPVTVSLPSDAEPGGRYGSLLVSIVSNPVEIAEDENAKPATVIISRIGTLFFVTTPGEINRSGELKEFSTLGSKKIYSKGPISFAVVSENYGTVHLAPYGEINIYNMAGNEVGSVELDPWFIMPQSLRVREISWNRDFMIGRYTAVASINRGYDDFIDEQSYTFWVIPWTLIALVFAGFFIFFLLLRFVFSQFEFKRKSN